MEKSNVLDDALSRRYALLATLDFCLLAFKSLKNYYGADVGFCEVFEKCAGVRMESLFYKMDFFEGNRQCVPKHPIREMLVQEAHSGGIACHFRVNKTIEVLKEHFYWPKTFRDVKNIMGKCVACHMEKGSFKPRLYTPLPVPVRPWEDDARRMMQEKWKICISRRLCDHMEFQR